MSYLLSLLVGSAFGIGYALLGIKSPAPPIVALFGLLGMIGGEHGATWVKRHYATVAVARLAGDGCLRTLSKTSSEASGDTE